MDTKRLWQVLTPQEQLRLRKEYGHHLDSMPATCSLDDKITRFQQWLAQRHIQFDRDDLKI